MKSKLISRISIAFQNRQINLLFDFYNLPFTFPSLRSLRLCGSKIDMPTPEPTTWTIHLAARRPGRAVAALLMVLVALFAIAALQAPPMVVALAALLLFGSIAEFLLPVTYTLDAAGAHARYFGSTRILPWNQVRRVYILPYGIKLSPLVSRTWAESYRGVMLRSPEHDQVLQAVRAWLTQAGAQPEFVEESTKR